MVVRRVSREKYFFAFLITAGIFALGLLLGLVIEAKRVDYVTFSGKEQQLDLTSLQLQYQFVHEFSQEKNCDGLLKTFDSSVRSLETIREKVENYRKDSSFNDRGFDSLKREYTLAQINYWLLYSRGKGVCDIDAATVLYFFADEEHCSNCDEQAVVLTWLKSKLGAKLLNFIFDGEFAEKEPIVGLLKQVYNITGYPTIVVNGETFKGFTDRTTILKEVCPSYKNKSIEVCEPYVENIKRA